MLFWALTEVTDTVFFLLEDSFPCLQQGAPGNLLCPVSPCYEKDKNFKTNE